MDVVTHVVVFVTAFQRKRSLSQRTQLAQTPFLEILMVEEVHTANSVWKKIQNSHGDEASVEAIAVVITS